HEDEREGEAHQRKEPLLNVSGSIGQWIAAVEGVADFIEHEQAGKQHAQGVANAHRQGFALALENEPRREEGNGRPRPTHGEPMSSQLKTGQLPTSDPMMRGSQIRRPSTINPSAATTGRSSGIWCRPATMAVVRAVTAKATVR